MDAKTRVYSVSPVALEAGKLFALKASATLNSVPPELFSVDPETLMRAAQIVEAGTVEVSLQDLGMLDVAIAEFAKTQGMSPETARARMLESFSQNAAVIVEANPDVKPVVDAIARFVQTKGETLTIKLTPKGRVPLMQLIQMGSLDPLPALLGAFVIEAKLAR